jgi:transposase-like protein
MKVAKRISLTEEERTILNVWLHLPMSARLVLRAKIILLAADGRTNQEIARQLRASRKTVSLWRRRFLEGRLAGINKEAPRGRQGPMVDEVVVRLILEKTKESPANVTHWTVRSLAKELGIPPATLHRVWKAYDLDSRQE